MKTVSHGYLNPISIGVLSNNSNLNFQKSSYTETIQSSTPIKCLVPNLLDDEGYKIGINYRIGTNFDSTTQKLNNIESLANVMKSSSQLDRLVDFSQTDRDLIGEHRQSVTVSEYAQQDPIVSHDLVVAQMSAKGMQWMFPLEVDKLNCNAISSTSTIDCPNLILNEDDIKETHRSANVRFKFVM